MMDPVLKSMMEQAMRHYAHGRFLESVGSKPEAIAEWEASAAGCTQAIGRFPAEAGQALIVRAGARICLGDRDGAISDVTKAFEFARTPGETANCHLLRSQIRIVSAEAVEALEDASRALAILPDLPGAHAVRARARLQRGDELRDKKQAAEAETEYRQALADLDRLIRLTPENAQAWSDRAVILSRLGLAEPAAQDHARAVEIAPSDADVHRQRGRAHQHAGRPDDAILEYTKAIELDPYDATNYVDRASARIQKRDLEGALADSERALKLSPGERQALLARANALVGLGRPDAALSDLDAILAGSPDDVYALLTRGMLRWGRGDREGALRDFAAAVEKPSMVQDDLRLWVWALRTLRGERAEADAELARHAEARGWAKPAHIASAMAHFVLGRIGEDRFVEITRFRRLADGHLRRRRAQFFVGIRRLLDGDRAGACRAFELCVSTGGKEIGEAWFAEAELRSLGKPGP